MIRFAVPADADWLVGELRELGRVNPHKQQLFGDEVYVRKLLAEVEQKHLILISESAAGERQGFIAGMFIQHILNPEIRLLYMLAWWVCPAHRNTTAGYKLLKMFADLGRDHAHWIQVGVTVRSPVDEKTMTKLGFEFLDRIYLMEA